LGERSVGHQDPGATSSWLLFEALASVCRQGITTPEVDRHGRPGAGLS
jgi:dihydroxyacetone kinase-like protein